MRSFSRKRRRPGATHTRRRTRRGTAPRGGVRGQRRPLKEAALCEPPPPPPERRRLPPPPPARFAGLPPPVRFAGFSPERPGWPPCALACPPWRLPPAAPPRRRLRPPPPPGARGASAAGPLPQAAREHALARGELDQHRVVEPWIRVVVGLMPAARVRSRTSRTWSSVISVTTVPSAPARAVRPGAVQVGLVLDRRVGVDDERDVVDVDAAGRDVGGDQRAGRAGVEGVQVAGAGVLAEVAVQLDRRDAARVELAGQRLGAVLGAGEDERAAGRAGQVDQHREPVRRGRTCSTWWVMVETGDCAESASCVTGLLRKRLTSTSTPRRASRRTASAGRRAGSGRAGGWTAGRKPRSAMWSASSRTVISTSLERAVALLDQVLEPAGAGDDDVDAVAQAGDLRVLADAAEDGQRGEPGGLGQRRERRVDLADQLAGRGQDQRRGVRRRGGCDGRRRAGRPAAAGRRRSCRSRCGRGRARRGRRASRAASRPGSGWGWRCRGREDPGKVAGTPRSANVADKKKSQSVGCLTKGGTSRGFGGR